jgi:uncharacterized damage-inducible protein DinB
MGLKKLIENYVGYNEWANQKIVQMLKALNTEVLYQQTPSSFTSIDHTLQHILNAQNFWYTFINEQDISLFKWTLKEGKVECILEDLLKSSIDLKANCSNYSEPDLEKILSLNSAWSKNSLSRYEFIIHAINHSTYHRGQIVTMARCLGLRDGIVNTDYNFYRNTSETLL